MYSQTKFKLYSLLIIPILGQVGQNVDEANKISKTEIARGYSVIHDPETNKYLCLKAGMSSKHLPSPSNQFDF